jgi:hypothetical protein
MTATADEYDALHAELFLPVVEVLSPMAARDESTYSDPAGRFSVPIPVSWSVRQADGYGILTSPDEGITIHVLAVEGGDLEGAAQVGWAVVDATFDLQPTRLSTGSAPAGVEQAVLFYDTGNENEIVIADVRLYERTAYLILAPTAPPTTSTAAS